MIASITFTYDNWIAVLYPQDSKSLRRLAALEISIFGTANKYSLRKLPSLYRISALTDPMPSSGFRRLSGTTIWPQVQVWLQVHVNKLIDIQKDTISDNEIRKALKNVCSLYICLQDSATSSFAADCDKWQKIIRPIALLLLSEQATSFGVGGTFKFVFSGSSLVLKLIMLWSRNCSPFTPPWNVVVKWWR